MQKRLVTSLKPKKHIFINVICYDMKEIFNQRDRVEIIFGWLQPNVTIIQVARLLVIVRQVNKSLY